MNMVGFGTMVDSVSAIKKVVYDDKEATLAEVRDAIMANFEGYEDLQAKLKAAPKYGNDDDYVDTMAADLWEHFATVFAGLKLYRAGQYCDAAIQMVQSRTSRGHTDIRYDVSYSAGRHTRTDSCRKKLRKTRLPGLHKRYTAQHVDQSLRVS